MTTENEPQTDSQEIEPQMTFWQKIRFILNARCDHTSQLLSGSLDKDLRWWELWGLRGHLLVCKHCRWSHRQFQSQLKLLKSAFKNLSETDHDGEVNPVTLSDEAKSRIKSKLE